MNNIAELILNVVEGFLLGGFFYLGLYWTVKKGLTSKHPGLLFAFSFFIRTAILLSGILIIAKGVFIHLLACTFGIILSRVIVFIVERQLSKAQGVNI